MKTPRSLILMLMVSLLMMVTACARPNYEETQRSPAANELGSCEAFFANAGACLDLIWERKPTKDDMGSFVVEFYNPNDRSDFVDLKNDLEVVLWMPSMGHGSSPVTVVKTAPGQYRVTNVFFIMPGDWEIQFKLKNGNTVLDQTALPYSY